MQRLGHIAEVFLVHDRPIARHADDSRRLGRGWTSHACCAGRGATRRCRCSCAQPMSRPSWPSAPTSEEHHQP
jgi:hypothetical protein